MAVKKIEALLDAIGRLNGISNPESEAYKLRNPLLIKSFGIPGKHQTDPDGRRVFDSMLSGYRAGLFDLEIKLSGRSRAKLGTQDTLENLLRVYGIEDADYIVAFLRRALVDQNLKKTVPLTFFLS